MTHKAVWVGLTSRTLKDFVIPTPAASEVLIKNVCVASNPKDWKGPVFIKGYEGIEGNDIAGIVERVGEGVTKFKVGDRVAAFTPMRSADKYGAYAEHSVAPEHTTFPLGPKTTFEDACTLPLAYMTACIGLFGRLGLPTPSNPSEQSPPLPVLIYGASSTVGVYAIQLAKLANLYVIGIAGAGCAHAMSYGADIVIDYRNKTSLELSTAIHRAASGRLRHVFDAISEGGTYETIGRALQPDGGHITFVLPQAPESPYANVEISRTLVAQAHTDEKEFAAEYFAKLGPWLEDGTIRGQKVTIVPGGLAGVEEGLRRLQAHEVRSEKLVYRLAETPL